MNLFGWVGKLFSSDGKGVVAQVNDTVERWNPSEVKKHEMGLDNIKAEDASQDSARKYEPSRSAMTGVPVVDIFNTIVDCANRLPRPALALWALCILFGVVPEPAHLAFLSQFTLNIIWTVIGFFFGIRTISQDVPKVITMFKK